MKRFWHILILITFLVISLVATTHPANAIVLTVVPSPIPKAYYSPVNVTLTSYPGASIVYTTNGSTPSATMSISGVLKITNGYLYLSPIYLTTTKTIKAIALKTSFSNSAVYIFTYEFYNSVQLAEAARVRHSKFDWNNVYANPYRIYFKAADGKIGYFKKYNYNTINDSWYTYSKSVYYFSNGYSPHKVLFLTALVSGKWPGIVSNSYQIRYEGSKSLEALVWANKNRPVYNIVVSFYKNGTMFGSHVMMIDAIINGKVYYSDRGKPGTWLVQDSIAKFKSAYSPSFFVISSATDIN